MCLVPRARLSALHALGARLSALLAVPLSALLSEFCTVQLIRSLAGHQGRQGPFALHDNVRGVKIEISEGGQRRRYRG
jgi:hypothetical protein